MKLQTKYKYFAIGYVFVILQLVNFDFWISNHFNYSKCLGILLMLIPAIFLIVRFRKICNLESVNDKSTEKFLLSIIALNLTITLITQVFFIYLKK